MGQHWDGVLRQFGLNLAVIFQEGGSVVLSAFAIAAGIAVLAFLLLVSVKSLRPHLQIVVSVGFVVALVAFFAGYLTTNTREMAFDAIAPVLLTGLGALFIYSVFKAKIHPVFAGYLTVVFALVFFSGSVLGSNHRDTYGQTAGVQSTSVEVSPTEQAAPTETAVASTQPDPTAASAGEPATVRFVPREMGASTDEQQTGTHSGGLSGPTQDSHEH